MLDKLMGYCPGKQSGPREVVDVQAQPPVKEQEWSISVCRKLSKYARRTAWVCRELLGDLRCKNEVHRKWKQVKTTQEEQKIFA